MIARYETRIADDMDVLVTGHDGYIGTTLAPMLEQCGHNVQGLDNAMFRRCGFGASPKPRRERLTDVRDVSVDDLRGFDMVMHLAGISNDPSGDLNPAATFAINHVATVRLAEKAKEAGVQRFLFSSSCSIYGAQGDEVLTEHATFAPVTPYGESKRLAEADLNELASEAFSPVYLRNATAYGVSPRLRGDLVVNNLTGFAVTTGRVFLKSDGSSWRPLVHIEDISRAFVALAEADRDVVHNEAFNVAATDENYQIKDVARIVAEVVDGSEVTLSDAAFDDPRSYRVNCDKLAERVPAARPQWTVRQGVEQLAAAMRKNALTLEELEGPRLMRVNYIQELQAAGLLDDDLRLTSVREGAN